MEVAFAIWSAAMILIALIYIGEHLIPTKDVLKNKTRGELLTLKKTIEERLDRE
jgi:hypothetical protein